jgi:arylsulfatase A-like enzyme
MGFDHCRWMFNTAHQKGVSEQADGVPVLHDAPEKGRPMTDWLVDKAIDFIDAGFGKPFCVTVGIPDPHEPHRVREPYAGMFRPEDMPIPETFDEPNPPTWARNEPMGCSFLHEREDSEAFLRESMAAYCGMVKCIDDNVGRLVGEIEARGLLEDTLIVFTTDHGDYMGEHGMMGKNRVYEGVYRIPLIMHWPAGLKAGIVMERFFSTVDFKPTLQGLLGLAATGNEQGRDGSALLAGKHAAWVDEVFFHHSRLRFGGIFTPEFELGLERNNEHVLFDRKQDPLQQHNLYGRNDMQSVADALVARVAAHFRDVGSPAADWIATV